MMCCMDSWPCTKASLSTFHFHHERVWARCSMTWAYQIRHMTSASIQMGGRGVSVLNEFYFVVFHPLIFFYIYFVFSEGFEIQTYTRHLSTVFKQWGFFCVPHEVTMTRDIHLQGHLWWPVAFTPAASHLAGELFDIRNIQILKKKPIIANFIHSF